MEFLWIFLNKLSGLCAKIRKANTGVSYRFKHTSFPQGVDIYEDEC